MQKINVVDCCNVITQGRIFEMPPKNKMRKVLVFADECQICGRPVARIKEINFDGSINTIKKCTGQKAIDLFNQYRSYENKPDHRIKNGTKNNMCWLWFDGLKDNWVRDFNNTKVFQVGL